MFLLLFFLTLPSFAGGQPCEEPLPPSAAKWSSDRQVRKIIELYQCPTLPPAVRELQTLYLKRFHLAAADPDPLFRILVGGRAEVDKLSRVKLDATDVLAKANWIGKVAIVGERVG